MNLHIISVGWKLFSSHAHPSFILMAVFKALLIINAVIERKREGKGREVD